MDLSVYNEIIQIILPYPHNIGISIDNKIFCDCNDSSGKYYSIELPIPKYKWHIIRRDDCLVTIGDRE